MTVDSIAAKRMLVIALLTALAAACTPGLDWREFSWDDGGFAVLLPGKPTKETRIVQIGGRALTLTLFRTEPAGAAVAVGFAELPVALDADGRARLLADARDALLKNVGASGGGDATVIEGFPGLAFHGAGTGGANKLMIAGRVYATDRRFYQLLFIGPPDLPIVADLPLFFGSFRLVK